MDTVFKIQDMANQLDFMGSVALNLGFALQTWDISTLGQEQKVLALFKKY